MWVVSNTLPPYLDKVLTRQNIRDPSGKGYQPLWIYLAVLLPVITYVDFKAKWSIKIHAIIIKTVTVDMQALAVISIPGSKTRGSCYDILYEKYFRQPTNSNYETYLVFWDTGQ